MLKIKDIRTYLYEELSEKYPETELRGFFNLIVESLFNLSNMEALIHSDRLIENHDIKEILFTSFN